MVDTSTSPLMDPKEEDKTQAVREASDVEKLGRFGRSEYRRYRRQGCSHDVAIKLTKISCSGNGYREVRRAERELMGRSLTHPGRKA